MEFWRCSLADQAITNLRSLTTRKLIIFQITHLPNLHRLLEFTEEQFGMFSRLLSQEQGSILKPLSAAIEPSLTTLINGLTPTRFFPLEDVGVEMIRNLPKGSREMIMCLMGHTVGGQNDIGFTRML
jgi:hypothetical protein